MVKRGEAKKDLEAQIWIWGLLYFFFALATTYFDVGHDQSPGSTRRAVIIILDGWRVFPMLALFWLGTLAYLAAVARSVRVPAAKLRSQGLRYGFFLHLGLLLLSLHGGLFGPHPVASKLAHVLYAWGVIGGFVVVLAWMSGRSLAGGAKDPLVSFLRWPFLAFSAYAALVFAWRADWVLLAVCVLGWGSGVFWRKGNSGRLSGSRLLRLGAKLKEDGPFQVALVTAVLLLTLFFTIQSTHRFTQFYAFDKPGLAYHEFAVGFLGGEQVLSADSMGYWVLLAGFYKVFGTHPALALIFQNLLAALSALLVYQLARSLASPAVARVAGVLFLLSYVRIWATLSLHWAFWVLLYALIVFWAADRYALTEGKVRWLALGGAFSALLIALRPENLFVLPALMTAFLIRRRPPGRFPWRRLGAFVAIALLCAAPFGLVNYRNVGSLYPVRDIEGGIGGGYSIAYQWDHQYRDVFPFSPFQSPAKAWAFFKAHPLRIGLNFLTKGGAETFPPGTNLWRRFVFGPTVLFSTVNWDYLDPLLLAIRSKYFYYLTFYGMAFTVLGMIFLWRHRPLHPLWFSIHLYLILRYLMHVLLALVPEAAFRYGVGFQPFIFFYLAIGLAGFLGVKGIFSGPQAPQKSASEGGYRIE